jgi:hypothetical protein
MTTMLPSFMTSPSLFTDSENRRVNTQLQHLFNGSKLYIELLSL